MIAVLRRAIHRVTTLDQRHASAAFARRCALRGGIAMLRRSGVPPGLRGRALLRVLAFGWGNSGWAASTEYLAAIADECRGVDAPFLKAGSGVSTIVIAAQLHRRNLRSVAIEHMLEAQRARNVVGMFPNASVACRPLIRQGEFDWYAFEPDDLPARIGLAVCDAPQSLTRGRRVGLFPLLHERFVSGAVILMDDAERSGEQEVLARWNEQYAVTPRSLRRLTVGSRGL